jgi:hypothetical protein
MRPIIGLFLFLILVSPILAKHEAIVAGPYNLSFDFPTIDVVHQDIKFLGPNSSETYEGSKYSYYMIFGLKFASRMSDEVWLQISIRKYNKSQDAHNESIIKRVKEELAGYNVETYRRIIDGKPGIVGVTVDNRDSNRYVIIYPVDYDPITYTESIECVIDTNYSWGRIFPLLDTIHIEYL